MSSHHGIAANKDKKGEHQHTQGHTCKRVIEATKITAETRDPPVRIPEITESSRSGITFTRALRRKHRQRRVTTRVVKTKNGETGGET